MSNWPAWVGAGAAAAGAGAAWFAAINGVRTLRQTRIDSIGRSRPMVAAEFRDAYPAHATLLLVVRNYGPSVAREVRVTFDPELPEPAPGDRSLLPFIKKRYEEPIAILTPGTELKNVYFTGQADGDGLVNFEGAPDRITVRIAYWSGDLKQRYEDTYSLDVAVLQGETYVTSSRSLEGQAKAIRGELQALKRGIDGVVRELAKKNELDEPSGTPR